MSQTQHQVIAVLLNALYRIAEGDQRPGHVAYKSKAAMAALARDAIENATRFAANLPTNIPRIDQS